MYQSKSVPIYQDKPSWYVSPTISIIIFAIILPTLSIYIISWTDIFVVLPLLIMGFFIALFSWFIMPRRYEVHQDHLSIVLGRPFSINIKFEKIITITVKNPKFAEWFTSFRTIGIFSNIWMIKKNYVEIAIDRIGNIAISPRDNTLFIENANRALSEWGKTRAK